MLTLWLSVSQKVSGFWEDGWLTVRSVKDFRVKDIRVNHRFRIENKWTGAYVD